MEREPQSSASAIAAHAMRWLEARRDEAAADGSAAYLRIAARGDPSPPLGVTKTRLGELARELKTRFLPTDEAELREQVEALWAQPWREPKYAAIEHARAFEKKLLTPASLPLLERMIRDGAWWDLVDPIAGWLVSPLYARHRKVVRRTLDRWRRDEDVWLRRAVLLAHLKQGEDADERALFDDVLALAHEKEFFIRKAIGWVLRDHSYAKPDAVQAFLNAHRDDLSRLSFREGARHLVRNGRMK